MVDASPGNLTPVFEAILNKAHALCGANLGSLTSYNQRALLTVSQTHGYPPEYEVCPFRARIKSTPLRSDFTGQQYVRGLGPSRKPLLVVSRDLGR